MTGSFLQLCLLGTGCSKKYSRTPFTRINWDGEPYGYAANLDNWIFLWKRVKLAVWIFRCIIPVVFYSQLNRGSFESKHNYIMLLYLFKLTTCFGLCTGSSSGHKIFNCGDYIEWIINKIVWIIKIWYLNFRYIYPIIMIHTILCMIHTL